MTDLINLIEGLQDIVITENENTIFFEIKRNNNTKILHEAQKKDVLNDIEFQNNLKNVSNLKNYYDRQQTDVLIETASNLDNYYDKNKMDFVLKYTNGLANYYTKFQTSALLQKIRADFGSDARFVDPIELIDSSTPTESPSNAGYLFSEGGALKWKGSSGTVTTVAPA